MRTAVIGAASGWRQGGAVRRDGMRIAFTPAVQVDSTRSPLPPGLPPGMRLSLPAGALASTAALALEVQSMSSSGLAVLTAARADAVDRHALAAVAEGAALTFELERDGERMTLRANLVWVELTDSGTGPRLELIVDTGDEAEWASLIAVPAE